MSATATQGGEEGGLGGILCRTRSLVARLWVSEVVQQADVAVMQILASLQAHGKLRMHTMPYET